MRYYYDLHVHSCLSPCADDDMTPSNIVGMAKVAGLDIVAVTDHNSVANVRAALKASEGLEGLLVIPGMELETSDSVHIVVLFEDIERAEEFERRIWSDCFRINNRKDIYGNQLLMDENDEVTGEKEELLLVSTNVSTYEAASLASEYGGVAIYAHVDREAHGALKVLGGLDELAGIHTAEISRHADEYTLNYLTQNGYRVINNSDAHTLYDIQGNEGVNYLELNSLSIEEVLKALK